MQLITKENALESLKSMKPGEVFHLKTDESVASALAFAVNGITALEQLFKLNIEKTEANKEIIEKIVEDYKQHVAVKELAIAKAITEGLDADVYNFYIANNSHFSVNYNPASGIISFERVYCQNCDSK